jgi:L-fuculose-phosphate aldolase
MIALSQIDIARRQLAEVCRLAYERGYICGTEGNFSIRLSANEILCTPRGTCKGRISAEQMVLVDAAGKEIDPHNPARVSTEFSMHMEAYKVRTDISAVVHAHPTVAVGFTVAGQSLSKCILPEVVCTLGDIPVAPYATPSTDEVPKSISALIAENDSLVLDHHGALTVGNDIWDAFYKLETLEHHAQTMLVAHMLGGVKPLYSSQVKRLLQIRGVYGLNRPLPEERLTSAACSLSDPEISS